MLKRSKVWRLLWSAVLCVLLSGCQVIGMDVEDQLRPPKNNGEQEGVQNALEAYIEETHANGEITDYVLKYPTEGKYLSSFLLLDEIHSHTVMTPSTEDTSSSSTNGSLENYGLAFYRMDADNEKTHINLLQKNDGKWTSVADVEGYSEEIAQVDFGDMNGDGFPELLVGWNMYNTKDKRLTVYDLTDGLCTVSTEVTYTSFIVNALTNDKADDLLVININTSGKRVIARLFSLANNELVIQGQIDLDSDIQKIEQSIVCELQAGVYGVFVDAYKDPHTTITELIYWEDGELHAPFCNQKTGLNTQTAREISMNCQDIDQDGTVEWPIGVRLPGYENSQAEEALWKTQWYSYDHKSGKTNYEFDAVVNLTDHYIVKLSENWPSDFTAVYDEQIRVMTFYVNGSHEDEQQQPFLKIQATTSGKKSDLQDGFVYFDETDSLYYAAWYSETDELLLSMTEIRYLFSAF